MNLKFLGRGSAFNPKEGNTSAYFIDNNQLFLIDCGETVFEKLVDSDLLKNIDSINLMITHTFRSCWQFRDTCNIFLFHIGKAIIYSYEAKG